jgi:hypothetical protein
MEPTLHELIDSCGDSFSHLLRVYNKNNKLRYIAVAVGDSLNVLPPGYTEEDMFKTPEKSVANLLLKIRGK